MLLKPLVKLFFPVFFYSRDQTTCIDSAFCYSSLEDEGLSVTDYSGMVDDSISCSHGDYPCRFTERSAWSQRVIPHRVFSPACLLQKAQVGSDKEPLRVVLIKFCMIKGDGISWRLCHYVRGFQLPSLGTLVNILDCISMGSG